MTPNLKALRVEVWRDGFRVDQSDLAHNERTLVRPLEVLKGDVVYLISEQSHELARLPFDGMVKRVLP